MLKLVLAGVAAFAAGSVIVPCLALWLISREPYDSSYWTD